MRISSTTVVPGIQRLAPTVLALVDLAGHDAQVVQAARGLAGSNHVTVTLLHVAPAVRNGTPDDRRHASWERMGALDAAAQRALRQLAVRLLPPTLQVQTSVRFGDVVEEVAKATVAVDATVVVASSSPAHGLWSRSRDRRLRRILDVPVILVPAREAETEGRTGDDPSGVVQPERAAVMAQRFREGRVLRPVADARLN